MTLMLVEVLYLWRALPFCSEEIKLRLLDMVDRARSSDGIPFHHGLRALMKGCILVSLDRFRDAEKVSPFLPFLKRERERAKVSCLIKLSSWRREGKREVSVISFVFPIALVPSRSCKV